MELLEMDRLFRSLLKKGYITDIEFRKIMKIEKFDDRKSEVFDILMLKDQTTAVEILNLFRRMTARARAKEYNGHHPLLSAVVADCIFGFLPTKDVLNCRLVCRQWRTASSNILRKRVTINFQTQGRGPYNFFEDFANCLPDIPFQYFKFLENNDGWNTTEIEDFFEKCGDKIKKLRFSPKHLFQEDKESVLKSYDITPLILKACNLTKLKVVCRVLHMSSEYIQEDTLLEIQLTQMSSVKFISLVGCQIFIHEASKDNIKIKPLKITLTDVTFKRGGVIGKKISLNDVIDFSEATKLNLYTGCSFDLAMDFDMMSQVLNVQSCHFVNLKPKNWTAATGKVYFLYLHDCDFVEQNQLQIQQLHSAYSTVNFSALPITIEKLHFSECMRLERGENINLPHLKYLRFDYSHDFYMLTSLRECSNLVELELLGNGWLYGAVNLNVNLIPKSVKRMKLASNIIITYRNADGSAGQEIRDEGFILTLGTLILEDYLHRLSSDVSEMMSIIKPKVLVVSCIDEKRDIDTTSICEFVYANRQLEKVIVGSKGNLHRKITFELSLFSRFVGRKKANYYQFENYHGKGNEDDDPIGKPLSSEEFELYAKMDELDQRFYYER